jgi:hypothetical protein
MSKCQKLKFQCKSKKFVVGSIEFLEKREVDLTQEDEQQVVKEINVDDSRAHILADEDEWNFDDKKIKKPAYNQVMPINAVNLQTSKKHHPSISINSEVLHQVKPAKFEERAKDVVPRLNLDDFNEVEVTQAMGSKPEEKHKVMASHFESKSHSISQNRYSVRRGSKSVNGNRNSPTLTSHLSDSRKANQFKNMANFSQSKRKSSFGHQIPVIKPEPLLKSKTETAGNLSNISQQILKGTREPKPKMLLSKIDDSSIEIESVDI